MIDLMERINRLARRVMDLERRETPETVHSTASVNNPPTSTELTALFGSPTTVGAGFAATLDDNGVGANYYLVRSDGSHWWIFTGTKAT